MAPLSGVAGAMATYQRLSALLRTLRQPCVTCELRENRKNISTCRLIHGPGVPLRPCAGVSRVPWWPGGVNGPLRGARHPPSGLSVLGVPGLGLLHTCLSARQKEIPEYLLGSISQVDTAEDDLLGDDLEEEKEEMEDEIIEFLTLRFIPWEETDSSFVIPCPACYCAMDDDDDNKMKEIFIDKHSGYFVCPWCNQDGCWTELKALLDSREDTITTITTLSNIFNTNVTPISHLCDDVLADSPLRGISRVTLRMCGAVVAGEGGSGRMLLLPVRDGCGDLVGVQSVSLVHPRPQIIRRYLVGKSWPFTAPPITTTTTTTTKRGKVVMVVVPTLCDVLALYEHKIMATSLPLDDVAALERYLLEVGVDEVVLWYQPSPPPRSLLLALLKTGIPCSVVPSGSGGGGDTPIHQLSIGEVRGRLGRALNAASPATTTFAHLKDKVYYRVTHREETAGVLWRRYTGLNELLLGHRAGEVTVLTGPTGAGKTTFMAEYSLDLCMQGVCTLWGSFEVGVVRLCEVLLQQYSGTTPPQDKQLFNSLATEFSTLPLHFLTFHGPQSVSDVVKAMEEAVEVWGIQHAIIDNLQFMLGTPVNTTSTAAPTVKTVDRWHQQDQAVGMLRRFATSTGCHLSLIVHPKKVPEGQPLCIESVYGSAKVTQEADNVLIIQVPGETTSGKRKVLQVAKNRYGGQLGDLPLRFHKESLTLSSFFTQTKTKGGQQRSGRERVGSLRRLKVEGLV